jgi:hypothetical protein
MVLKFLTCPGRKNGKSLALLINGLQLKNHKFVALKRTSQEKMFKLNRRVPQSSTQSAAEKIDIKRLCGTLRLLSVLCVKNS